MRFTVYNGEYPFDKVLGELTAETPEEALKEALNQYGNIFPHCVVGPYQAPSTDAV